MAEVIKIVDGKRIIEDDSIIREIKCFACKHLIMHLYPYCASFLDEPIPKEVRSENRSDHTLPMSELPGYQGPKERLDPTTGLPMVFEPYPERGRKRSPHVTFDRSASIDDMVNLISSMVQESQADAKSDQEGRDIKETM